MEKKFEMTPEMKAKIDAKIKEIKEKEEHGEIKPLNFEELDTVAGGATGDFHPETTVQPCGWNYYELTDMLVFIYSMYEDDPAYARDFTIGCAEEFTWSGVWHEMRHLSYPAFIYEGARI